MPEPFKKDLPFDEFIYKLKKELEYHRNGETVYRQQTAKMALDVALTVRKVTPFLNPVKVKKTVDGYFPSHGNHRKNDVAKMLRVIARSIYLERTVPEEVNEYVNKKVKNKVVLK
ncbi:hypothetical protein HUG20_18530 [Salicibibacter cibi]|uniref:Uncharacterized protein n=1 Tax=Salicibibacter cibi TaxID=2743001 RepID=A0A7T6ZDV3_9BACI|nr:hypothetical protein [Salicibibacter cibi]QQK81713.1 hypothetical protein HUG20_18530 [Salicibibacter cibi]